MYLTVRNKLKLSNAFRFELGGGTGNNDNVNDNENGSGGNTLQIQQTTIMSPAHLIDGFYKSVPKLFCIQAPT